MTVSPENAAWFADTFAKLTDNVGRALLGKASVIRLALTCLLAEGHLLLEDAPGTGKTALARAIAATVLLVAAHDRVRCHARVLREAVLGVADPDLP